MFDISASWQYFETAQSNVLKDGRCGAVKRAADKMFAMSWVVTVGPSMGIGKDNLTTLAPPAPTGRSQHVFRQCPLDADIVSHLN